MKTIIAAHFGELRGPNSMEESYAEICKTVDLMGFTGKVPVIKGAKRSIDKAPDQESASADFIIEEAMRDDPRPLICAFIRPLTDLAIATKKEPRICGRMSVIWTGGPCFPDGSWEYNLNNDIDAANCVLLSDVPFSMINIECYDHMQISLAELQDRLSQCGKVGNYLFEQLIEGNYRNCANNSWQATRTQWPMGESWCIVDVSAVALALDPLHYNYEWKPAPFYSKDCHIFSERLARPIRFYNAIDPRYAYNDLFAKLKIVYGDQN